MKKRTLIALVAGLAVFASTFAFAATLGTLTSGEVGASNVLVAACDTDGVTTSYSAASWDTTAKKYKVASLTVTGINDACDGDAIKVTLADSTNVQLGEATGTVPVAAGVFTSGALTVTPSAEAALVSNVHVVIGS